MTNCYDNAPTVEIQSFGLRTFFVSTSPVVRYRCNYFGILLAGINNNLSPLQVPALKVQQLSRGVSSISWPVLKVPQLSRGVSSSSSSWPALRIQQLSTGVSSSRPALRVPQLSRGASSSWPTDSSAVWASSYRRRWTNPSPRRTWPPASSLWSTARSRSTKYSNI